MTVRSEVRRSSIPSRACPPAARRSSPCSRSATGTRSCANRYSPRIRGFPVRISSRSPSMDRSATSRSTTTPLARTRSSPPRSPASSVVSVRRADADLATLRPEQVRSLRLRHRRRALGRPLPLRLAAPVERPLFLEAGRSASGFALCDRKATEQELLSSCTDFDIVGYLPSPLWNPYGKPPPCRIEPRRDCRRRSSRSFPVTGCRGAAAAAGGDPRAAAGAAGAADRGADRAAAGARRLRGLPDVPVPGE